MSRRLRDVGWLLLICFANVTVLGHALHYAPILGFHAHHSHGSHTLCHGHHHSCHGHHHCHHVVETHSAANDQDSNVNLRHDHDHDCLLCQYFSQGKLTTDTVFGEIGFSNSTCFAPQLPLAPTQHFFTPYSPRGPPAMGISIS